MINKEKSLLSICIPTYNRAKYLSRLLADIVAPCKNMGIDILISDNGSTDDTLKVLESYQHNANFRYVRNNTNLENDSNPLKYDRNILNLFRHASSQYVWLMGDDDLIDINYLSEIIAIIREYPDFGLIYLDYDFQIGGVNTFMSVTRPVAYEYVNQQTYCDQVLHRATLLSANIINLKYYSSNMLNQVCLGKGWMHVHIILKIIDMIAGRGIKNIIIKEKILKQKTGTAGKDVFMLWFIDNFNAVVSLSGVTHVSLRMFMRRFYYLAVRGAILEMAWENTFIKSWKTFRSIKDIYHISLYDEIVFILTTCAYRIIGMQRLKKMKKHPILNKIILFLRRKFIRGDKIAEQAIGDILDCQFKYE